MHIEPGASLFTRQALCDRLSTIRAFLCRLSHCSVSMVTAHLHRLCLNDDSVHSVCGAGMMTHCPTGLCMSRQSAGQPGNHGGRVHCGLCLQPRYGVCMVSQYPLICWDGVVDCWSMACKDTLPAALVLSLPGCSFTCWRFMLAPVSLHLRFCVFVPTSL